MRAGRSYAERVTLPPSSYSPPPDPPPPPYPSYPAQRGDIGPPPSKTRAGWALGLAILPSLLSWFISVALAVSVLSDARDGRDHGQRMAKAALVIVACWVVLAIVVVVLVVSTSAERDDNGKVTEGGRSRVLSLRLGDCLPDVQTGELTRTVDLVPCEEPHKAQVIALFDLKGTFTTRDDISQQAEEGCVERFSSYVGSKVRDTRLGLIDVVPPDETAFRESPGVICIAVSPEPVSETFQGSRL